MMTEIQIRSYLIRRIQKIPSNKLIELYKLVTKLELIPSHKDKNVTFEGALENMDSETFDNLTVHLTERANPSTTDSPEGK